MCGRSWMPLASSVPPSSGSPRVGRCASSSLLPTRPAPQRSCCRAPLRAWFNRPNRNSAIHPRQRRPSSPGSKSGGTGAVFANFYPSAAHDPGLREQLARYERNGASPSAMVDIVEMVGEIDVRAILPTIGVPTLVVHSTGDAVISVEHGRYLAEHIAGARYIELTSGDHLTFRAGESGAVDDVEEFLTGQRPVHNPDRILTTVLFTDIVDSTRRAVELGDQRWRLVLDQHDDVMRQQLGRFGGREVNTTGDGFLAAFDGPARAVQCAVTVSEAVRLLGLEVRAGVHTGECEQRAGDLGGIGVHIGARVAALAEPSQVLVSRTVTDLVAGSGLRFTDRGEYELKGVPGLWQLFAVEAV